MVSCDDQDHQQAQLLAGGESGRSSIESSTEPDYEAVESTELEQSGGRAGHFAADVIRQQKMDPTIAEECNIRAADITKAEGRNTGAIECITSWGTLQRLEGIGSGRQFSNKVEHDVSMSVCVCMTAYAHVHVCTYLCADVHESFS